jgi:hypothetical protein
MCAPTSMNMREESRRSVTLSDSSSNTRSWAWDEIFINPALEAAVAAAGTEQYSTVQGEEKMGEIS